MSGARSFVFVKFAVAEVQIGFQIDKLSDDPATREAQMEWDTSSFGNDGARDWLEFLSVSKTGDPVREAIDIVDGSDNFIDAGDAERAVAAAEVIAASRNFASPKLPETVSLWLKAQRYQAPDALAARAANVIGRILSTSELRDLWDGTSAAGDWLKTVRDLQFRLEQIEKNPLPVVTAAGPADAESVFNEAVEYVSEGAHDAAVQKYDRCLEIDPTFVIGYIGRGTSHLALGKFDEALDDFNKAIDLGPEITEIYYLRAQAYFQTEKLGRAIADLTILINKDQSRSDAYFMRGLGNAELGRHEKAIDDFTKAIELDSELVNAYLHRAQAYEKLGRFDMAGKDQKQAERLTGKTRIL